MKTSIISTATFLTLAAGALPLHAGTYTANIPEGETTTIDAAFVATLGTDDLVKTGRGTLVSSADMASYTGTITIREGAFKIRTTSDLGTADGGTVVEDGGTLLVDMTSGNERFSNEQFTIAGTGDAAYGAAVYQVRSNDRFKLFKYLTLSGDATIYAGTRLGVDGGTLTMNGHTLTLKGVNYQFRDVTYASPLGNLVVEANLAFVRNQTATADATKTLTVTGNSGRIGFTEAYTTPSFWALVVENGGKVVSHTTSTYTWGSDVVWNAATEDGITGLLTFTGDVTGTGTIKASDATLTFAKPLGANLGLNLSGTATASLKGCSYSHKGLLIGYRTDGWTAGFDSNRADTRWSYCPFGPGPQIDRSFWGEGNGQKEVWCSRGYLWNREATNITVQFFIGNVYQSWVYLDGSCVYDNKRDSWVASSQFEIPAGTCKSFEVRTNDGGASNYGGPRNDNDKLKINGVIANDPTGYYFTTNAVSTLTDTPALTVLSLADDGVLDANNMPVSVDALSGAGIVTNTTALTIADSWTLTAADVIDGAMLEVDGDVVFGNGATISVSNLRSLPVRQTYTICKADSISGIANNTLITEQARVWKVVLSGDGTTLSIENVPQATVVYLR